MHVSTHLRLVYPSKLPSFIHPREISLPLIHYSTRNGSLMPILDSASHKIVIVDRKKYWYCSSFLEEPTRNLPIRSENSLFEEAMDIEETSLVHLRIQWSPFAPKTPVAMPTGVTEGPGGHSRRSCAGCFRPPWPSPTYLRGHHSRWIEEVGLGQFGGLEGGRDYENKHSDKLGGRYYNPDSFTCLSRARSSGSTHPKPIHPHSFLHLTR